MQWNIVADSSCDIFSLTEPGENVSFGTVPFIINVSGTDYVDDDGLSVPVLLDAMESSADASHTACPSPQAWAEFFRRPGPCFAVTISGSLSGSFSCACAAREMVLEEMPGKEIHVIDSLGTGPSLFLIIERLQELIRSGLDYAAVCGKIDEFTRHLSIVFALCSFDNLVKNGRMSRLAGTVARKLSLWGVGIGSDKGEIVMKKITRGAKSVVETIVRDIEERGHNVKRVVIDHCGNAELAARLHVAILQHFPGTEVQILTTRGLCSYYAERAGIIVSY